MIKRAMVFVLLFVAALALAVVGNTFRQGSRQLDVPPLARLAVDADAVAASMAEAVRARTVTGLMDPARTAAAFDALHSHLA